MKLTREMVDKAANEMLKTRELLYKTVSGKKTDTKTVKPKRADFKPSLKFVDYPDYWQSQLEYWNLDK